MCGRGLGAKARGGDQAVAGDNSATRRQFLTRLPSATAVGMAAAAVPFGSSADAGQGAADYISGGAAERAGDSYQVREEAGRGESQVPIPKPISTGARPNTRMK